MRRNGPPVTFNTLAKRLIASAQERCEGCKTNWRLVPGTFRHPVPGGTVECWAQPQRHALRGIAADRLPPKRWHIRIQRRCAYNGRYGVNDWRAYREWLVWPKTFPTAKAAQRFMEECFTFKGLHGSKLSASVCECKREASPHRGAW